MNETLRYCAGRGTVVNAFRPVADSPYDFVWAGLEAELGCNRLRCSRCGQVVRDGAKWTAEFLDVERSASLHASDEWKPFAVRGWIRSCENDRLYLCRCASWGVKQPARLDDPYYDDFMGPAPASWACAGHPRPEVPFELDGEFLGKETDWRALARGGMLDDRATSRPRSLRRQPALWVERLFRLLEPDPPAAAVTAAVRELLTDADARVRDAAGEFLRRISDRG